MSLNIWTQCEGPKHLEELKTDAWRVVEDQHLISSNKYTDGAADQELLERLIETAKPPLPQGKGFTGLHYLLFTPFRYPPLRYGSRFGKHTERGLWYGALSESTALAEKA